MHFGAVTSHNNALRIMGEGGHDVQHEIVLRGVFKLRRADDHESDFETPKLIEQRHVMMNAPRQPIKAVNKDLIDRAAPNESKQSVQRRTIERRSRIAVVVKRSGKSVQPRSRCESRYNRTPRTGRRTTRESEELTDWRV